MSEHLPVDELADFAAGLLEPARALPVEDHLRSCAGCRRTVTDLSEVTRLLSEHEPAAEMPAPVAHRLEAVLQRESARRSTRRRLTGGLAAHAAAVVVGLRRSFRSGDDLDR